MPKVDLGFGRTKYIKLHLKLFKEVQAWMFSNVHGLVFPIPIQTIFKRVHICRNDNFSEKGVPYF